MPSTERVVRKITPAVNRTTNQFCKIFCIITCILVCVLCLQALWLADKAQQGGSFRAGPEPGAEEAALPDYYTILNITADATQNDIKRAYRRQMKHYHPDKVQRLDAATRQEAEEKFKLATEAYETLMTIDRCTYNNKLVKGGVTEYMNCMEWHWEQVRKQNMAAAKKKAAEEAARWEERWTPPKPKAGRRKEKEEAPRDEGNRGERDEFFATEPPFTALTLVNTWWNRFCKGLYFAYHAFIALFRPHR